MKLERMTTTDLIVLIDHIRDHLGEGRRYVATQGAAAKTSIFVAQSLMGLAKGQTRFHIESDLRRFACNLDRGLDGILVDPDALRGYIDGTRHELAVIRGRLERGEIKLEKKR